MKNFDEELLFFFHSSYQTLNIDKLGIFLRNLFRRFRESGIYFLAPFVWKKLRKKGIKIEPCNLARNICADLCPLKMEAF